ncbi:MAG: hypothetical protein AAGA31_09450 [Bacteroidota bacterium]
MLRFDSLDGSEEYEEKAELLARTQDAMCGLSAKKRKCGGLQKELVLNEAN